VLISNAHAQQAAAADPMGGFMQLLPIILMFVVLYFLMIRPQMKRAKEHKALIEALAKGDEVVTGGGIAGRITKVSDQLHQPRSRRCTSRSRCRSRRSRVLPKGTLRAL
jgi:preprotein translocase subunit YajC